MQNKHNYHVSYHHATLDSGSFIKYGHLGRVSVVKITSYKKERESGDK